MPPKRVTITLTERSQGILARICQDSGQSQSAAINSTLNYLEDLDARVARAMIMTQKEYCGEIRKTIREELKRFHNAPK